MLRRSLLILINLWGVLADEGFREGNSVQHSCFFLSGDGDGGGGYQRDEKASIKTWFRDALGDDRDCFLCGAKSFSNNPTIYSPKQRTSDTFLLYSTGKRSLLGGGCCCVLCRVSH